MYIHCVCLQVLLIQCMLLPQFTRTAMVLTVHEIDLHKEIVICDITDNTGINSMKLTHAYISHFNTVMHQLKHNSLND